MACMIVTEDVSYKEIEDFYQHLMRYFKRLFDFDLEYITQPGY